MSIICLRQMLSKFVSFILAHSVFVNIFHHEIMKKERANWLVY